MRYAVAIMCYHNDNLLVQIIEADSIKEAVKKHSACKSKDMQQFVSECGESLLELSEAFENVECLLEVVPIKD